MAPTGTSTPLRMTGEAQRALHLVGAEREHRAAVDGARSDTVLCGRGGHHQVRRGAVAGIDALRLAPRADRAHRVPRGGDERVGRLRAETLARASAG